MFIEFWMKCECPSCKVGNWVYDSHSDRSYSSSDFFALKCWNCGACNWRDDEAQEECQMTCGEYENEDTADEKEIPVKPEDHAEQGRERPS